MTLLKRIAATALSGFAALGFASASYATPERGGLIQEGSIDAHVVLAQAIERVGVNFVVNHKFCEENPQIMGFYSGSHDLLVVCQDNYVPGGGQVAWTANDLDTLRHEAQHLIQDCMIGENTDHVLGNVYRYPVQLGLSILGVKRINEITITYRRSGADDDTLRLEYEAFAVAQMNVPLEQTQDIAEYCGV
tara:strand:+ start:996 stop:1568 length:573 start_codon:yes stop_codon:yes gene_type:complete